MPSDVTGIGGAAGGVPIPPSAPLRPVAPSRALVPVEKAGPRGIPPSDSPLSRSGIALADLFFAADLLETREAVAPVAMEMGLESARGQLLRQLPGEALVALDAVWSGARTSEEGWYLRSGALTVMGHPSEADRVATEGLESQPTSLALRLMQSVARAVVGDLSGARAALSPALSAAPTNPVLMAQQAVVLARQGHADDAADTVLQLSHLAPEHPALAWARGEIRAARTDRARGTARSVLSEPPMAQVSDAPPPEIDAEALQGPADSAPEEDIVTSAFARLGARLATLHDDQLTTTARTLLRACSTGGAIASACMPEEAHAARQVLSALLIVVRQDVAAPSPLQSLMGQLLPLLRGHGRVTSTGFGDRPVALEGALRLDEAVRLLRRAGASVTPPVRRLLEVLLGGATHAVRSHDLEAAHEMSLSGEYPVVHRDERDAGPLIPVRLGLSLLADSAASRAFERAQQVESAPHALPDDLSGRRGATPVSGVMTTGGEALGVGWGGARAASAVRGEHAEPPASAGSAAALPAILLVAGALIAVVNGAAALAALLGGAAVFTALRRAPSRND